MAIWQSSYWTIPYEAIQRQYGGIPETISEDDFNHIHWFQDYDIADFTNSISYLAPADHWNKEAKFWGHYEQSSILIDYTDKQVSEIYIRIDLRYNAKEIAEAMLSSIHIGKLILLDTDLNVVTREDALRRHLDLLSQKFDVKPSFIEELEEKIRGQQSLEALRELLVKYKENGMPQQVMRQCLMEIHDTKNKENRTTEHEDTILELLDFVEGFCSPQFKLYE